MPTTEKNRSQDQSAQSGITDRARQTASAATDRVNDALGSARERLEDSPMAALIGGIALGAVAGALLPRTQREQETLGPIANRISHAAADAARAARDAGKQELGLSGEIKSPAEAILDKALGAASAAGQAAAHSVTGS